MYWGKAWRSEKKKMMSLPRKSHILLTKTTIRRQNERKKPAKKMIFFLLGGCLSTNSYESLNYAEWCAWVFYERMYFGRWANQKIQRRKKSPEWTAHTIYHSLSYIYIFLQMPVEWKMKMVCTRDGFLVLFLVVGVLFKRVQKKNERSERE